MTSASLRSKRGKGNIRWCRTLRHDTSANIDDSFIYFFSESDSHSQFCHYNLNKERRRSDLKVFSICVLRSLKWFRNLISHKTSKTCIIFLQSVCVPCDIKSWNVPRCKIQTFNIMIKVTLFDYDYSSWYYVLGSLNSPTMLHNNITGNTLQNDNSLSLSTTIAVSVEAQNSAEKSGVDWTMAGCRERDRGS